MKWYTKWHNVCKKNLFKDTIEDFGCRAMANSYRSFIFSFLSVFFFFYINSNFKAQNKEAFFQIFPLLQHHLTSDVLLRWCRINSQNAILCSLYLTSGNKISSEAQEHSFNIKIQKILHYFFSFTNPSFFFKSQVSVFFFCFVRNKRIF